MQNKQLKPQKLTQTYLEEQCMLPKNVRDEIRKTEIKVKSTILETDKKRQKRQNDKLIQAKKAMKQLQQKNKPLGAKHRILEDDRIQFGDLIEEVTGERIENKLKQWRPLKWRNFFVRTVCSSEGNNGEELRKNWTKIYEGDLKWGVRDARLRAQEKNWPRRDSNAYLQQQDRNSWISFSLLKSFQTNAKISEKKHKK
jgi:regulatory protein YycI of two-component signal transduction system YycFG